jgi:hypothetical protein
MNNSIMKLLLVTAGLLGAMQVQAIEAKFELGFGHDRGGEKIYVGQTNSLDPTNSAQYANANEGFMLTLGGAFTNDEAKQFETVASIGLKTSDPWAPYGDVSFKATPLTVMENYRMSDMRMGLGATYSINPKFTYKPSGVITDQFETNFDNALGLVAQIGWVPLGKRFGINLRYTSIKYSASNLNQKFDGSSFGINGSVRF